MRAARRSAIGRRRRKWCAETHPTNRAGTALVTVLVVIVLLTLATYSFTGLMVQEQEAASMFDRDAQARLAAESGFEYAAALIGASTDLSTENFYHDPTLFQAVPIQAASTGNTARLTIIAPLEQRLDGSGVRYGLMDESGKLNINALLTMDLDDEQLLDILMALPEMTEDIADSMLDWIDDDSERRPYGAEDETYSSLSPPYLTKNAPLESVDELLLVFGVTHEALFGEDANRNGRLDPEENDGDLRPPLDNADGVLQAGWSQFLTVSSRESNLRADGTPRINVNESLLTDLYDELELEYGEDVARFVTAFRIAGPNELVLDSPNATQTDGSSRQSTGDLETDAALNEFAENVAEGLFSGSGGSVSRGGLDLSEGASYTINSLYELVDAEVEIKVNDAETTLVSPWTSQDAASTLPLLLDSLTTTSRSFLTGRVNVNQAREEVLLAIPEMPPEVAAAIVAASPVASDGSIRSDVSTRNTTAWLVAEGLVSVEQMRLLDPFLTARGDVFRVQSVGFFDSGGPVIRLEGIIDATQSPPRLTMFRELTHLGRGYSHDELLPAGAVTGPQ